jgi:ABC-2 type transport system ATP-binding protein
MDRWRVALFGYRLHVIVDESAEEGTRRVTEALSKEGIRVQDVREETYSLEDVFIAVVEKAREQGKVAKEE